MSTTHRRFFINAATCSAAYARPQLHAQTPPAQRQFNPKPRAWRMRWPCPGSETGLPHAPVCETAEQRLDS